MSTQPTDDDLTACYREANGENTGKAQPLTTARIFKAMRAAIAKWGTPVAGGEPVAYVDQFELAHIGLEAFEPTISKAPVSPHDVALYTSPQPVREPMTPEQRDALWESYKYDDGEEWTVDWEQIVDAVERHHGITGGQT